MDIRTVRKLMAAIRRHTDLKIKLKSERGGVDEHGHGWATLTLIMDKNNYHVELQYEVRDDHLYEPGEDATNRNIDMELYTCGRYVHIEGYLDAEDLIDTVVRRGKYCMGEIDCRWYPYKAHDAGEFPPEFWWALKDKKVRGPL